MILKRLSRHLENCKSYGKTSNCSCNRTVKGKGYKNSRRSTWTLVWVGPFNVEDGEFIKKCSKSATAVFADALAELSNNHMKCSW